MSSKYEYKIISLFDTAIANYNIGNQIITDAIVSELNELFPTSFLIRLPIEDIKTNARKYHYRSVLSFVGGTNLLNTDIRHYRQWDLDLHNIWALKNLILMGCGWYQYENRKVTKYTQWALKRVLSTNIVHSVRDQYTQERLAEIGINSINTGCPTLWKLTPEHIAAIPQGKNENVVITLTDYNRNPQRDQQLLSSLIRNYNKIYVFPQGTGDVDYIRSFVEFSKFIILPPRLEEFNSILESGCDYVGTRLHAGIRALQKKQRSFIIGIDNRALEMGRDFQLPVIHQENTSDLEELLYKPYKQKLNIPFENINQWKDQFRK